MDDMTSTLNVNVTGAFFTIVAFLELLDAGNKKAVEGGFRAPPSPGSDVPSIQSQVIVTRKYDYQKAQCEDPDIIRSWFALVRNTIAKYSIQKADIYNFDETGFQIGVISTVMVVTSSERRGRAKSKQPSNRE